MKKIQLSEAIRLGSLLVRNPRAGVTEGCAIGMALLAHGIEPLGGVCWDYERVMLLYPWLGMIFPCRWCDLSPCYQSVLTHPFDVHVMTGEATIEELCDWIAEIEPPTWAWGVPEDAPARHEGTFPNMGLAVGWR